jgi:O-antigen ligase
MTPVSGEPLPLSVAILAIVASGYVILWSRIELAAAIQLSTFAWMPVMNIGPVKLSWFIVGVLGATIVVFIVRHRDAARNLGRLGWLGPWVLAWWFWTAALLLLFSSEKTELFYMFGGITVPSAVAFSLFASIPARVRLFAIAYVVVTVLGAFLVLSSVDASLVGLLLDPNMRAQRGWRMNLTNYHWFAFACVFSLLFLLQLMKECRSLLIRSVTMLGCFVCVAFALLSNSRQGLVAGIGSCIAFLLYSRREKLSLVTKICVTGGLILSGAWIVSRSPELVLRSDEAHFSEAVELKADRRSLQAEAWSLFAESPLYGTGYRFYYSHNVFLGALAESGIVGGLFLCGFLVAILRRMLTVWREQTSEGTDWRVPFVCIVLFTLIAGLVSGSTLSVHPLYWAAAVFMMLKGPRKNPARVFVRHLRQASTGNIIR